MTEHSAGANTMASTDVDDEIDLKDLLAQLLARKWMILFFVVLGTLLGAAWGLIPPSIFRASALVQIEQRSDKVFLPSELVGDLLTGLQSQDSGLETEVHVIRSRLVLQPVVERLGEQTIVIPEGFPVVGDALARYDLPVLDEVLAPEHARAGESIDVSIFDLAESDPDNPFRLTVEGPETYALALPNGDVLSGRVGEELTLPNDGTMVVSDMTADTGREYLIYQQPLRKAVERIRGGLKISERDDTGIVDFDYETAQETKAVPLLNAVIREYMNQNLRRRSAEIDNSIAFIEEQLADNAIELEEANKELAEFRRNSEIVELAAGTQELLNTAVEMESRIDELEFQKEQLLQNLTINHPDVRAIEAEERRYQERLEEIRGELTRLPEVEQDLAVLVQRVEKARALEQQLRARVEQLRVLQASTVGNIRVLEPAEIAEPVGPNRLMPAALGGLLGLVLSAFGALALNALRRGVEDGREIEALGLPLFATINKAPQTIGIGSADKRYGLALHDPESLIVESMRGLRTGLKFAMASAESKTLMVSSCAPGDGKSFISLNLAIVSGQSGLKVLLIDADMRRGFLRKYFGLDRDHPGLSDVLTGKNKDCIQTYEKEKIDFLATGRFPPNPTELLDSKAFEELLAWANEKYDLVIVDAPPVLVAADATIIGQQVGMKMLVVRHLVTTEPEILSAQKTLQTAGVRLSGAILNQYDESKSRYGRYGQKYGHYYGGYRYKYGRDESSD